MPPEFKSIYDKQEDIPESVEDFRGLFTEKNGKFEMTGIAGVQTPANVARLETGLKKERDDHKATKAKLDVWGDMDHADVQKNLDRMPELEAAAAGKLDDAKIEEIVTRRVEGVIKSKMSPLERDIKKLTKDNGELTEANSGFTAANTKRTVQDSMRKAMRESKVLSGAEDDIFMYSNLFEVTEEGNVVTRDGVGVTPGLDPAGWLTDMQDKREHWWPGSQGAGARGSDGRGGGFTGKNPWSYQGWNMTEQGRYATKHGMERAGKMAEAAGTSIGGSRPEKPK